MKPIDYAHQTYRTWFGDGYDLEVLNIVLAVAACVYLDGDQPWLNVVGGSGSGKTETIAPLAGAGATMASSISSEGALLSATSKREQAENATGGLLRTIGSQGILVLKDFTTILSMGSDARNQVLAALREIYDGRWTRNVGTDGGQTLTWEGRLVLIGGVTTAWDSAHAVVSEMGDRFLIVRVDSTTGRTAASRQALSNVGDEIEMRRELSHAVASVLNSRTATVEPLNAYDNELLIQAADLVTRARTAVIRDNQGNVIDAHAPESPTRFAKQLKQVMRGAMSLDMSHDRALRLALRAARDSLPPMRLACLVDVYRNPESLVSDVRKRLQKPRTSVDRELQALHQLGLLILDEVAVGMRTEWRYTLEDPEYQLAVGMLADLAAYPFGQVDTIEPTGESESAA